MPGGREAQTNAPGSLPDDGDGLFLGMISGTSADGIDVALVRFEGETTLLLHGATYPYPTELRTLILDLSQASGQIKLDDFAALDQRIGTHFAEAALSSLAAAGVTAESVLALGSHGQTLRHRPHGPHPFTLQVGDASVIAERTGIRVVADFRRRDVAAGGQGAPLLPALHAALFADADSDVAVLNLGGIANLTLLPRAGGATGFDTGPANCLLDAWSMRHRGTAHDEGGTWAASGTVAPALLESMLAESFFALPAPRSTGRDRFHLGWLDRLLPAGKFDPADVQATLLELTARTIAEALKSELPDAARVLACGGGVHNAALMRRLSTLVSPAALTTTDAYGLDPDFVEAAGFAWLARQTLLGRPGNVPAVTGARGARVLGAIHAA